MTEVVFISDLHLHPREHQLTERFNTFIDWAVKSTKTVYILGDFFHAWPGDSAIDHWSAGIAQKIQRLINSGISVYFMSGNRDFLLGKRFARLSGWTVLSDPCLIELGGKRVLLSHGDGYCTKDLDHQRFMRFTRNKVFITIFQLLPLRLRHYLVDSVREKSQKSYPKDPEQMDVVTESVLSDMNRHSVNYLIHGHTHRPGLSTYPSSSVVLFRFVLSDWDDIPQILCYDDTKGFYYIQT